MCGCGPKGAVRFVLFGLVHAGVRVYESFGDDGTCVWNLRSTKRVISGSFCKGYIKGEGVRMEENGPWDVDFWTPRVFCVMD
jgi:hypothetical protein